MLQGGFRFVGCDGGKGAFNKTLDVEHEQVYIGTITPDQSFLKVPKDRIDTE
jgi:hypothetical protein